MRTFAITLGLFASATVAYGPVSKVRPFAVERKDLVALIIGNNNYRFVPSLKTAINDALSVQAVLHDQFQFTTTLLLDATRAEIITALTRYRSTLSPDSSLLIYYGGHGFKDADVDKAYWWPVDAKPDIPSEWISADDITTAIKALPARHVLIVSDSCYSGKLMRGVERSSFPPGTDRSGVLQKLKQRQSRELLASGGNEPVADGGAGDHSIFAGAFLRSLTEESKSEFAVREIISELQESVGGRSAQLPELDPIANSGHDGGGFVFTRAPIPPKNIFSPLPSPLRQRLISLIEGKSGFINQVAALRDGECDLYILHEGFTITRTQSSTIPLGDVDILRTKFEAPGSPVKGGFNMFPLVSITTFHNRIRISSTSDFRNEYVSNASVFLPDEKDGPEALSILKQLAEECRNQNWSTGR